MPSILDDGNDEEPRGTGLLSIGKMVQVGAMTEEEEREDDEEAD